MRIEGKVLNVGDGDAIIIKAIKAGEELLIVVDGGDTLSDLIHCINSCL